jgi:hypothetical protein
MSMKIFYKVNKIELSISRNNLMSFLNLYSFCKKLQVFFILEITVTIACVSHIDTGYLYMRHTAEQCCVKKLSSLLL